MPEFVDAIWRHVTDVLSVLVAIPTNPTEKFFLGYVASFVFLAWISWRFVYRSKKGFWRFVFPRRIYFHRSARVDYGIFLINLFISPFILVGAGLATWLSIEVGNGLIGLNDGAPVFRGNWDAWTYAGFILGYTLAADLAVYLVHRFHHQSDVFWPIHALHHSAEVMTPVTLFRKHPLWNLVAHLGHVTLTGLFQGLFVFVFYGVPAVEVLFGINTVYVFYNLFGANLRHSHIWLAWPRWLSHIFISPAMHQIHHDPERMTRNYGEVFAIWDWMFGSLYIPKKREKFAIGLGDGVNPHDTLARAYVEPLAEMGRQAAAKFRPADKSSS